MALTDNLIAHWKLNEASGTRLDSHDSHDLTDNNTVGVTTGKLGNAADFEDADKEYLSAADTPNLDPGDTDWTIAFWAIFDELSVADRALVTKDDGTGDRQYRIAWDEPNDVFQFFVFGTSNGVIGHAEATTFGAPSTGTWYFIVCKHSAADNEVRIKVNNVEDTAATTAAAGTGTATFRVGAAAGSGVVDQLHNGAIDSVSFWHRLTTDAEDTQLYNSGDGLDYDDWSPSGASADVSPAALTLTAPAVSAQFHSRTSQSPAELSLTAPGVSAQFHSRATVSPAELTFTVPAVSARFRSRAAVSPAALTLTAPAVSASTDVAPTGALRVTGVRQENLQVTGVRSSSLRLAGARITPGLQIEQVHQR